MVGCLMNKVLEKILKEVFHITVSIINFKIAPVSCVMVLFGSVLLEFKPSEHFKYLYKEVAATGSLTSLCPYFCKILLKGHLCLVYY
jgi:hypothetical protein